MRTRTSCRRRSASSATGSTRTTSSTRRPTRTCCTSSSRSGSAAARASRTSFAADPTDVFFVARDRRGRVRDDRRLAALPGRHASCSPTAASASWPRGCSASPSCRSSTRTWRSTTSRRSRRSAWRSTARRASCARGGCVDYLLAGAGLGPGVRDQVHRRDRAAADARGGRRLAGRPPAIAGLDGHRAASSIAGLSPRWSPSSSPTPMRCWTSRGFRDGLQHQTSVADDALGKLGLTEDNGLAYYLWTLTWGLGWVPAVAAGVGVVLRRPRQLADRRRPGPGAAAVPAVHGHPGALLRALADAGLPDDLPAGGLRRAAGASSSGGAGRRWPRRCSCSPPRCSAARG